MTEQWEYALMAGASYRSNRALINRFPEKSGTPEIRNPGTPYWFLI
jgi:hypothetical protein